MHISQPVTPIAGAASSPSLSILYVLGAFPVLSETFVSNEIRAMRAHGHRVLPLALAPHAGTCQPEDEAFRAETLALGNFPAATALLQAAANPLRLRSAMQFATAQKGIRPRSLLLAGARVALAARRYGCRHLHAHFALASAATAITAAKLAGLTASFTAHGYDVYGTPADLPVKLAAADLVVAVCEDMRNDLLRLAPQARVELVQCGIDPFRFQPASGHRNGRLLAVGRLVEQKGYDVLLDALALLPPKERPVIDAIGAGEMSEALKHAAASRGLNDALRFLGPRDNAWIASNGPNYLGFVAPYRICANGDRDVGPIVVKEALAMGLPVVASSLMGLKEMVAPGCGRQFPPGDAAALAEALRWVVSLSEEERQRIGQAGRRRAIEHHSLAGQAAALTAAIAALPR